MPQAIVTHGEELQDRIHSHLLWLSGREKTPTQTVMITIPSLPLIIQKEDGDEEEKEEQEQLKVKINITHVRLEELLLMNIIFLSLPNIFLSNFNFHASFLW